MTNKPSEREEKSCGSRTWNLSGIDSNGTSPLKSGTAMVNRVGNGGQNGDFGVKGEARSEKA